MRRRHGVWVRSADPEDVEVEAGDGGDRGGLTLKRQQLWEWVLGTPNAAQAQPLHRFQLEPPPGETLRRETPRQVSRRQLPAAPGGRGLPAFADSGIICVQPSTDR